MDTNLILWVLQVLLALAFLAAGLGHISRYDQMVLQPATNWVTAVGRDRLRIIGILEVLGAIGLVLPGVTGILPWLVPTAAAALALLMVFAAVFHLRRSGEGRNTVLNAVLGLLALAVAVGRFVIAPF